MGAACAAVHSQPGAALPCERQHTELAQQVAAVVHAGLGDAQASTAVLPLAAALLDLQPALPFHPVQENFVSGLGWLQDPLQRELVGVA